MVLMMGNWAKLPKTNTTKKQQKNITNITN
jgi:hypothetical protein